MHFEKILERIKKETDIKNISQLAKFLETTQPYVSRKKKSDEFPVKWAYEIAQKYKLSTDWIMKGEGPKRLTIQNKEHDEYILMLEEWIKELIKNDQRKKNWFQCAIEETFPAFKEWMEEKTGKKQEQKAA